MISMTDTTRRIEILRLIRRGMTRKAIAAQLGISIYTLDTYIKRIYRSYKVSNRAELLSALYKEGSTEHATEV